MILDFGIINGRIAQTFINCKCVGFARRRAGLSNEWGKIRILEKFLTGGKDSEKFFLKNIKKI